MKLPFRAPLAAVVAASLLAGSTAAMAAPPAASLSAGPVRAADPAGEEKLHAAVPTGTLISIGVLAALIVIVLVATNNGNDTPDSP